jgi:CheY-like chemotaxis protein
MTVEPLEILLAEDNEDDIVLIRETLQGGRLVNLLKVVRDGEEAIAYLRGQGPYAGAKRPGLVLLDINMPKKNGLEVLAEIKSDPALKSLPVVMLTVSNREVDVLQAYASGACTYIRKPVNFGEFQKVVEQFCIYWAMIARLPNEGGRT